MNDASNMWSYDAMQRLRSAEAYDPAGKAIYEQTYTYNAASIPTHLDVYLRSYYGESYEKFYSYDGLLRLTEEHKRRASDKVSQWRRAYQYDAAGNRTQMVNFDGTSTSTIGYTYNAGNQLEEDGTNEYMYDNNGNMVYRSDGSDWMYYDHNRENRLVSVEEGAGFRAFYYYDAMGRRIVREGGNNLQRYYYDGLNVLMVKEKPDGCSSWRTKKAYTLKQAAIGQIISERENTFCGCGTTPSSSTDRWYHYDRLGNVMALTDADSGPAIAVFDQEAFGNVLSGSQSGFRITTKEYDAHAGLYYFNARWYASETGRFMEATAFSPIAEHAYSFANQAPTAYVDVNGKLPSPAPKPTPGPNPTPGPKPSPTPKPTPTPTPVPTPTPMPTTKHFVKIWGNYCGAGNAGGEPVDAIDACCKKHDEGYGQYNISNVPPDVKKKADNALCDCLNNISMGQISSQYQEQARQAVGKYFGCKMQCLKE